MKNYLFIEIDTEDKKKENENSKSKPGLDPCTTDSLVEHSSTLLCWHLVEEIFNWLIKKCFNYLLLKKLKAFCRWAKINIVLPKGRTGSFVAQKDHSYLWEAFGSTVFLMNCSSLLRVVVAVGRRARRRVSGSGEPFKCNVPTYILKSSLFT